MCHKELLRGVKALAAFAPCSNFVFRKSEANTVLKKIPPRKGGGWSLQTEMCQISEYGCFTDDHKGLVATKTILQVKVSHHHRLSSQLCVVIIFLVTVVVCRGIISVMMYHTGSPVLQTEVFHM